MVSVTGYYKMHHRIRRRGSYTMIGMGL
jgi:hypothetical protein